MAVRVKKILGATGHTYNLNAQLGIGSAVANGIAAGGGYQYSTKGTMRCKRWCDENGCGPWDCVDTNPNAPEFTGDTGKTLDWQIGFEEPPYFGLFGSKKKKEEDARADAMRDARNDHPAPKSCDELPVLLEKVRGHIASTQKSIDTGETSSRVGPRYLEAYNTILQEYLAYYNANCLMSGGSGTSQQVTIPANTGGGGVNNDPMAQTVLPSVTQTPSQVAANQSQPLSGWPPPGSTNNTGLAAAVNEAQNEYSKTQANATPASSKTTAIPKWAMYAGAGIGVVTVAMLLLKKRS